MKSFAEYQALASKVPISLRNDRDRINLPVSGMQEATGKIGSLLEQAFASGKFNLTAGQRLEFQDRLSDLLWCAALLCNETGVSLQDVAAHSVAQLRAKAKDIDPDQR